MNIVLTKEFFEKEYVQKEKSVKEISKETGFSYSYLQSKIHQLKIERRHQYKDLKGKKFGKLRVISFSHLDNRQQSWWLCKCKCGKEKVIRSYNLKSKCTKSCGCLHHRSRYGDITGSYFFNIKNGAKRRKLIFNITKEEIWDLYLQQNKKCSISGVDIVFDTKIKVNTTASLDRIDNSKGYIIDNIQWVHKDVNNMKSDWPQDKLLKWIDIVSNYQKSKILF